MTGSRTEWDGKPVPPQRWFSDHLSTLLYIESCIVDHDGQPKAANMRSKASGSRRVHGFTGDHPTRLAGGEELHGHDDWDCVDDLIAAGLVINDGTGTNHLWRLTDTGWAMVARLRRHLGDRPNGQRSYKGFDPCPE